MKNWPSALDLITESFLTAFGSVPAKQLNWKPDSKTWSIAQNLDHLIVVNSSYFSVLDALADGTYKKPFLAGMGFLVDYFGKVVLEAVSPERRKRMKTFSLWEPAESTIGTDILNRFVLHQGLLKDKISMSEASIRKGVVISSPANRIIVYKLETAFDIIVAHEKRHLEQGKEVLEKLKNV